MAEENTTTATAYALEDVNGPVKPGQANAGVNHNASPNHRCCGGCCDVRRAVVVVNLIQLCFLAFSVVGLSFMTYMNRHPGAYSDLDGNGITDDEITQFYNELNSVNFIYVWIHTAISIIATVGGIYGAIQYQYVPVLFCGSMYFINAILALIMFDVGGFVYNIFFAYPHYFLFQEIRAGIMTKENYPNIEYSCCCV
jgi:hypothetical protein